MDGIMNSRNTYLIGRQSPHQCGIKTSTSIFRQCILGNEHLGPNRLTRVVYHRFLVNYLPAILKYVPLHQQHVWFMHDGEPPYFLGIVRQHLNQTFGEQWIGRGGPVNWTVRSPDLNPMEFWLWGRLKTLVYLAPISDLEILQQRAENACQEIRVIPGIFDRVRTSVGRRSESCVEMHGNHREHLL
jgi:hypothetical protein